MNKEILAFLIASFLIYITMRFIHRTAIPGLAAILTKELDKNPKWITSRLKDRYYGFDDIDFITAECSMGALPRFRVSKSDSCRLEFLVPNDASVDDVELLGKIALAGKLQLKYGMKPLLNKPLGYLSLVCFVLDNDDVTNKIKFKDKKPLDDCNNI